MATKASAKKEPTLAEILSKKGGKYLSEFEKKEFSANGTQFTVTKVEQTQSAYQGKKRDRWELTINYGTTKGRVLAIPTHELRDETMDALAYLVKKQGPQGPIILAVREMENGNTWLSLSTPRKEK